MNLDRILPAADRQAVEAAVRAAEARTGCQIVVTVVPACDDYQHAAWKGATFGALAAALLVGLYSRGLEVWGVVWAWLLLPAPLGAVLGFFLARNATVRRGLVTPEVWRRRVESRAAEAFLEAGVHRTATHRGVLLFLAVFERRVMVLADDGVRAGLPAPALDAVASAVSAAIASVGAGAALVRGVERCAAVLAEHGFAGTGGGANELPDAVRVEE